MEQLIIERLEEIIAYYKTNKRCLMRIYLASIIDGELFQPENSILWETGYHNQANISYWFDESSFSLNGKAILAIELYDHDKGLCINETEPFEYMTVKETFTECTNLLCGQWFIRGNSSSTLCERCEDYLANKDDEPEYLDNFDSSLTDEHCDDNYGTGCEGCPRYIECKSNY